MTLLLPHSSAAPEEVLTIRALPAELQQAVLLVLSAFAPDLGLASGCCTSWRSTAREIATGCLSELLHQSRPWAACEAPVRALYSAQQLAARVGVWPTAQSWRDEWPALRLAQARHLAAVKGRDSVGVLEEKMRAMGGLDEVRRFFSRGGVGWIDAEAEASYASSLRWKEDHGWPADRALEVSLLASRCPGALARAIVEGRPEFAASCWTLCAALWERSWLTPSSAAPAVAVPARCYAALDGDFGLASADPAWEALRSPNAQPGLTLRTSGFPVLMEANARSFPNGRGFHMPITTHASVQYEPIDSDVVCFHPARTATPCDAPPLLVSTLEPTALIATDEAIWRLPPFVKITLLGVQAAGAWCAHVDDQSTAEPIDRRCFDVAVGL